MRVFKREFSESACGPFFFFGKFTCTTRACLPPLFFIFRLCHFAAPANSKEAVVVIAPGKTG